MLCKFLQLHGAFGGQLAVQGTQQFAGRFVSRVLDYTSVGTNGFPCFVDHLVRSVGYSGLQPGVPGVAEASREKLAYQKGAIFGCLSPGRSKTVERKRQKAGIDAFEQFHRNLQQASVQPSFRPGGYEVPLPDQAICLGLDRLHALGLVRGGKIAELVDIFVVII